MLEPDVIKRVLAVALERGGDFAELYVEDSHALGLSLEDDKIERVSAGHDLGAGVRVVLGDATGYAYSDDVSEERLIEAARTARAVAGQGAPSAVADLRRAESATTHEIRLRPESGPEREKAELLRRANAVARAASPEVRQVTARYGESRQRVQIANSEGLLAEDERRAVQLVVGVTALRDGRLQTAQRARGGQRGLEIFEGDEPERLGSEAARVAIELLDAAPAPAGMLPVVVTHGWGAVLFHEAVGHGLEADHVVHDSSVYAGKLGQQVANAIVTLVDDATIPGHRGSYRFDDEGVPSQRTVLVDKGVLVGLMSDRKSARKLGFASSGNGRRQSFQHLPVPRMSNLYIEPGPATPDEIIRDTPRGIFVVSIGGGMVEPARGEFVFSVSEAYLIEDGKLTRPVRGATLAGDSFRVLADIDAVANDFALDPGMGNCGKLGQWVPVGVGQPTLRVREMLVGDRMNPLDLCQDLVSRARKAGAEQAEAFFGDHTVSTIEVRNQDVESLISATQRGIGIRALVGGATGYSYTTDLSATALEEVAGIAVRLAREATPDPDRALPETTARVDGELGIFDATLPAAPTERKIELLRAVERVAREADPRVKDTDLTRYVDTYGATALANSLGFADSFQSSMCYALVSILAREGDEAQRGYGYTFGHGLNDLSPEEAGERAAYRAVATLGGRKVPTSKPIVIMEPEIAAEFLGNVVGALSADAILKGRSMFLGKDGQRVAAERVTLVDQGNLPGGLGSEPFDGEGVPTGRTELIHGGTLAGWLHNTYTARRLGAARSTGNAARASFRGAPGVGPTNLLLEAGDTSPAELRRGVQRGFQVVLSKNVGGINAVTGDYSVGASGLWIDDGEVAHPVSQVTIAGNMLEMLQGMVALGDDLRWIPGAGIVGTPTIHFEGMTVAGE